MKPRDRISVGIDAVEVGIAGNSYRGRFDDHSRSAIEVSRPILERNFGEWERAGLITGRLPAFGCILCPRQVGSRDTLAFSGWLADR